MADPQLAEWVRRYVAEAGAEDRVESFVQHVDSAILAEIPELAADPVLVTELHASTRSQFQVFLSLLEREHQELLLPPQAVDFALSIARRQMDLGVLLKVYRVAAASVWEFFTEAVGQIPEDGPDGVEALVYLWGHGGTWINQAIEQLIGDFATEREATLRGALARRTEAVQALLRGDRIDTDDASIALGHNLNAAHTALVVWAADESAPDVLTDLNRLVTTLGAAVRGQPLTVTAGRAEVWGWLATRNSLDVDAVRSAFDAVDGAVRADLRVSVGSCISGAAGFRQSHREAVEAQRHAVAVGGTRRFTAYPDVELGCLVSGDPDGVRTLIARELGGLALDQRGNDRIRETLWEYLVAGGGVDQAARRLTVHKNTVRYRLGQAEELIGHPLSERRTELALALACFERYLRPAGG